MPRDKCTARLVCGLLGGGVLVCASTALSPHAVFAAPAAAGTINLFAGGNTGGTGGSPLSAVVNPESVALDSTRHILYIADSADNKVFKVTPGADGVIGQTNSSGQYTDADDTITIVAGTGADGSNEKTNATALGDGGPAASALLSAVEGLAVDAAGNLYIGDYGDNRVRFVCQTAGGCTLPSGATLAQGDITSIAGTGTGADSGNGAAATAASTWAPWGIALDSSGNLLVIDNASGGDGSVRYICVKGNSGSSTQCTVPASSTILPKGDITTLAGTSVGQFAGDSGDGGPATAAVMSNPHWVTVDSAGDYYLVSAGGVRKVTTGGTISTAIPATSCPNPSIGNIGQIQVTSDGSALYLASQAHCGNNSFVYNITLATKAQTVVAGNGTGGTTGDGGVATAAEVSPNGIALDSAGDLFLTDSFRVRQVGGASSAAPGDINTVAGNGSSVFLGDGGPAVNAGFNRGPSYLATDSSGNVYITDQSDSRVRFVCNKPATASCSTPFGSVTGGNITTVAGNGSCNVQSCYAGDGGLATSAEVNPDALAVDPNGNLFIANAGGPQTVTGVRFVCMQLSTCTTPFGQLGSGGITTVAGGGLGGFSGDGGPAIQAAVLLDDLATDGAGNLYFTDNTDDRVRFICMRLTACSTAFGQVLSGNIITVGGTGVRTNNGDGGPAINAAITPKGLALDQSGNLYVGSQFASTIRSVCVQTTMCQTNSGLISPGNIATIAGTGSSCTYSSKSTCGDGGPATSASFNEVTSLAVDSAGNLIVGDGSANVIRVICMVASCPSYLSNRTPIAQGAINTIAGTGTSGSSGDGHPANTADIEFLSGLAVDGANDVFLSQGQVGAPFVREVTAPVTLQPYVTPLKPSFANQQVGTSSPAQTVTLSNPTAASVTVSSVGLSGANASDYSVLSGGDHCTGVAIAAGGSCTVQVGYAPTGFGRRQATLTFTDSGGPTTTQTAGLVGLADSAKVGVVGSDSALYTKQDQQAYVDLGGVLVAPPAMVSVPGAAGTTPTVLYIVVGADHSLYVRSDTQNWQFLSTVGVSCLDTAGAAVSPANGGGYTLTVACQGSDHGLYFAQTPVTAGTLPTVSSWTGLGGILTAGPQVTYLGSTVFFIVEGGGGQLYQTTTSGGYTVVNGSCIAHPATASNGTTAYLACHGQDGALYYATNTGGGWSGFTDLGGVVLDAPGLALTTGQLTFYVEGSDHALYHRVLAVGGTTPGPFVNDGGVLTFGPGAVGMLGS